MENVKKDEDAQLSKQSKTATKPSKNKKLADPAQASIDEATQMMLKRAHELEIDTVFDRAENMKPCNIDKKRNALGIDKARERILVDMATRREMASA